MQLENVVLVSFLLLFSSILNCATCWYDQEEVKVFTFQSESLSRGDTGGKAHLSPLTNNPLQKFSWSLFVRQTDPFFDVLTAGYFLIGE